MKYLFTLLITSTIWFISFGQNKYVPFISLNKYWIYSQQDDSEPVPKTIGGFLFSIGSDTIINGISYAKLIKYGLDGDSPCPDKPCFTPYIPYQINTNFQESFAYLREDTFLRKVYCLPAFDFDKFCDTTEHVLYDFDQKVGDTLIICNLLIHSGWPISDHYFIIDSIKPEFIYNKIRKVSYFNGFVYGGMPNIRPMKMIEGVGLENNLGFYVDHKVTFVDYCEGTLVQCNIISSTKDEAKKDIDIKIYPNPATDFISFYIDQNSKQKVNQYCIRDISGQLIKGIRPITSDINYVIHTHDFPSGMYIIQFLKDEQIVQYEKFIISH